MNIGDTLFHDGKTYIIDSVKENDNKDWIVFGANVSERNPDEKPLTIEVGKFYKDSDDEKWECITIHGGMAFMASKINRHAMFCIGRNDLFGNPSKEIVSEWPDEKPVPDIRWERIPDQYRTICVHPIHALMSINQRSTVFGNENKESDDWAFPNWRDFIGQTFERPKA